MPWIVKLVKNPRTNPYGPGYFPRRFHYKKYAKVVQRIVEENGGTVSIEKDKKPTVVVVLPDMGPLTLRSLKG